MNQRQQWIFHTAYWCFILFYEDGLMLLTQGIKTFSLSDFKSPFFWTSTAFMLLTAYAALWVLNRYFDARKYGAMILGLLLVIAGYISSRFLVEEWGANLLLGIHNYYYNSSFTWPYYIWDNAVNAMSYLAHAAVLKMVQDFFRNEQLKAQLVLEKQKAELSFLRSQLNPHFLFNTLNNIYTLSYQGSPAAPPALLKLADMMRYMLYDSNETVVPLVKEMAYLEDLVALEKLRLPPEVQVLFTVTGEPGTATIAPLLLSPLVENAFKHGLFDESHTPLRIALEVSGNQVHLLVSNKTGKQSTDQQGGVGLNNIARRLQLLYPGRHELTWGIEKSVFTAELKLVLHE
jgi:sensor histidine kinase YesM